MSTATPSPATAYSSAPPRQPPLPTPSPFSFSVASNRWSPRPPVQTVNLIIRFLAFVLSSASAISLAAKPRKQGYSFWDYPEFVYCFSVNILESIYAAYQLIKSICDIAHSGIFISDIVSDYISFIFDQLAGYLLVSASSVAVPAIQKMNNGDPIKKAATISVFMSFALFLVIASSALISGFTLCKRIIW